MKIFDKTKWASPKDFETPTIFLAGPCPRGKIEDTHWDKHWQGHAVKILEQSGFTGNVCIPLPYVNEDFSAGVEWEQYHLDNSTVILFWIPRDLETLPGFTTNVEFGEYYKTKLCVLGYPEGTPKMRYLAVKAIKQGIPIRHSLENAVHKAMSMAMSIKRDR